LHQTLQFFSNKNLSKHAATTSNINIKNQSTASTCTCTTSKSRDMGKKNRCHQLLRDA